MGSIPSTRTIKILLDKLDDLCYNIYIKVVQQNFIKVLPKLHTFEQSKTTLQVIKVSQQSFY